MHENYIANARRRRNRRSGVTIMLLNFMVTLIGVVAIVFLTVQLKYISEDYNNFMEVDYNDLAYMENIGLQLYRHESLVFQHMATEASDEKKLLQDEANLVEEDLNKVLSDFGQNMKGRKYEAYYHTIYSGVISYFKNIDIIFELSDLGDVNTARYHMNNALKDFIKTVNDNTDELKLLTRENMEAKEASMRKNILVSRIAVLILLAILIVFGLIAQFKCGSLTGEIVNMDSLTEIPNADMCEAYMHKLYKKKKLSKYTSILLNIKDFNYTNRRYGSVTGDKLLNAFAKTLQDKLVKGELVSRQAGDTFMVIIEQERAEEFLAEIATMRVSVEVGNANKEFKLHLRCGIYPIMPDDTVSDVMNCVSMTLNTAKHSKEDQVWFSKEQYEQILQEKKVLDQFNQGLKNKEFVVYYQPKVDPKTNKLCGSEALVRWFKDGKLVPPGSFIPVLEKEGKVVDLDFYVFERVCEDISRWEKEGIAPVRVSSNFSKLHLKNKHLSEKLLGIVKDNKVKPEFLEVELTESSGYDNLKALKGFVKQMNKADIHTSMDDFGTGYSSLSMLKDVDVDVVKLDKSFLDGVDQGDKVKEKMIAHLVHMIQDLDRTVVCEGVETKKELEFLKSVSCDMIQGYYFDKPLPRDEFENRLRNPLYS